MKTVIATVIAITLVSPALAHKEPVKPTVGPMCEIVTEVKPKPVSPFKKIDKGNKIVNNEKLG